MRLTHVHVKDFHSVRDSNEFEVGGTTCLDGKNEAGKTAVLQAPYRLNPIIPEHGHYSVTDDYPRWDVEDYRIGIEEQGLEHAVVVRTVFDLADADIALVEGVFGTDVLKDRKSV